MSTTIIQMPPLFKWQREVHDANIRFSVLVCGRRIGKTHFGAMECLAETFSSASNNIWAAPTYATSLLGYDILRKLVYQINTAVPDLITEIKTEKKFLNNETGGTISWRSADNPDSLRGLKIDGICVLDECALLKPSTFFEVVRPALADGGGRTIFISTPRGKTNWLYDLYLRGMSEEYPDWRSWRYISAENPQMTPDEIEAMKRDMTHTQFRQECYAEFSASDSSVFNPDDVHKCVYTAQQTGPQTGHVYVAGVDLAKTTDYTVVTIIDKNEKKVVYIDRFNNMDYTTQVERIKQLYNEWHISKMSVEQNNVGMAIIDMLIKEGVKVNSFLTTNKTKCEIIEKLIIAIEKQEIQLINNQILIDELINFEKHQSANNNTIYTAPSGKHDDMVMSLAIGWSHFNRKTGQKVLTMSRYKLGIF